MKSSKNKVTWNGPSDITNVFCIILCLIVTTTNAQNNGCSYQQDIVAGETYYIANPNYPNVTNGATHCQYLATSIYRIRMECQISLPSTDGCRYSELTIFPNMRTPLRYCGQNQFTVISDGQELLTRFRNEYNALGSYFVCQLRALVEDSQNCNCGWKKPTRIVGGTETGVNEFPMMAGLVDANEREIICGATIISNRYVITAAHCVQNRDISRLGVVVGEHDVTTSRETSATKLFRVEQVYIHPLYNDTVNDLAIILIDGTISFGPLVGPACLPFHHYSDSFIGDYVTILGWGLTEFGGVKSNVLLKADVSVESFIACKQQYKSLTTRQMCTYAANRDSCQMDSGGPLLWRNPTSRRLVLVGVISYGMACGDKMSVNTRIGNYLDWILSVTQTPFCRAE